MVLDRSVSHMPKRPGRGDRRVWWLARAFQLAAQLEHSVNVTEASSRGGKKPPELRLRCVQWPHERGSLVRATVLRTGEVRLDAGWNDLAKALPRAARIGRRLAKDKRLAERIKAALAPGDELARPRRKARKFKTEASDAAASGR